MRKQEHDGKPILHRAQGDSMDAPPSSLGLLTNALLAVSQAKAELDRVLREQFPVGISIVFVKGTKREVGEVVSHGHDGTLNVRLSEKPFKLKRVSAHEIRA